MDTCEECLVRPATTYPIIHEEWGPLALCPVCLKKMRDAGELED